jgi:hypothetical protein
MERDVEKSTLDVLALASVMGLLAGAALGVAGAPWPVTAYFSIVGALFDIMFTYDFFTRLQKSSPRFPWLAFLSSVLPLAFVSGPFLAGWAVNDLGAAAVRGFWLGAWPARGLAVLAALRLLRVTRPFWTPADAMGRCEPSLTPAYRAAAIAGIAAVLAGAFASDALLIPGPARASEAHRAVAMTTIAAAQDDAERVTTAHAAEALALRILGRPLLGAPPGLFPAEYTVESFEGIETWFPVAAERRTRAAAAAIAALASLAAATGYAVACRGRNRSGHQPGQHRRGEQKQACEESDCDRNDVRNSRRDVPAGTAELDGILGKRPH